MILSESVTNCVPYKKKGIPIIASPIIIAIILYTLDYVMFKDYFF